MNRGKLSARPNTINSRTVMGTCNGATDGRTSRKREPEEVEPEPHDFYRPRGVLE
jgi:hypothetical protein